MRVFETFPFYCCYYSNLKELVEFFSSASVFNFVFGAKHWQKATQILWFFQKKHLPNWQKSGFCLGGCCQIHAIYELYGIEKSHLLSRNPPRDACHSISVRELRKTKLCSAWWSHIQSFFFFFGGENLQFGDLLFIIY